MTSLTTHILDTSRGKPAAGVHVSLERADADRQWHSVAHAETDQDGRVRTWSPPQSIEPGLFRLTFQTDKYFEAQNVRTFYPVVIVVFNVDAGETHYHVPLLLNPYGYTTYRGS